MSYCTLKLPLLQREKFPILIELYILTLGIFCFTKGFNENLEDYYEELNANFGCKSLMSDFDNHGHSYLYLYSLPNSYCFKSYYDFYFKCIHFIVVINIINPNVYIISGHLKFQMV